MLGTRRSLLLGGLSLAAPTLARPQDFANDRVFTPADTIRLEHSDRMTRIERATNRMGVSPPPRFSTVEVPASRMPANFPVGAPVLRVAFSERTFFDTARWSLQDGGLTALAAVAEAARGEAPDVAIFVAGHTDNRGGEAYNYNLSVQRANTVAEALQGLGIGDTALWRVGFGEAAPLYANDSDDHRAFNRRVEFLFGARVEPVVDVLSRQLDDVCVADSTTESAKCRRELPARREFEAVQLTRRPVGVGLDGRRPVTTGATASGAAAIGSRASASTTTIGSRTAALATPVRMTIPLIRSRSIAAPIR